MVRIVPRWNEAAVKRSANTRYILCRGRDYTRFVYRDPDTLIKQLAVEFGLAEPLWEPDAFQLRVRSEIGISNGPRDWIIILPDQKIVKVTNVLAFMRNLPRQQWLDNADSILRLEQFVY
jgi:hypothetical protein